VASTLMKGADASLARRRATSVLPHPVGPTMRMFLGMMSSRRAGGLTRCRRHRVRRALATARLASAWPTMWRSRWATTARGVRLEAAVVGSSGVALAAASRAGGGGAALVAPVPPAPPAASSGGGGAAAAASAAEAFQGRSAAAAALQARRLAAGPAAARLGAAAASRACVVWCGGMGACQGKAGRGAWVVPGRGG